MDKETAIMYNGKDGDVYNIILDEEGVKLFNSYRWYINDYKKSVYLARREKGKKTYFHREIMSATKGQEVDHINRNKLDNRKCNLRFVTHQQNLMNASMKSNNISGHRGVCFENWSKKWLVKIGVNGKSKNLGRYANYNDACNVYEEKAKEYFGNYMGEVSNG